MQVYDIVVALDIIPHFRSPDRDSDIKHWVQRFSKNYHSRLLLFLNSSLRYTYIFSVTANLRKSHSLSSQPTSNCFVFSPGGSESLRFEYSQSQTFISSYASGPSRANVITLLGLQILHI